jgi:hypothetical protein
LTWVSEGYEFLRLRVTVKAGEVVDVAMLAHGSLLWCVEAGFYHATGKTGKARPPTLRATAPMNAALAGKPLP